MEPGWRPAGDWRPPNGLLSGNREAHGGGSAEPFHLAVGIQRPFPFCPRRAPAGWRCNSRHPPSCASRRRRKAFRFGFEADAGWPANGSVSPSSPVRAAKRKVGDAPEPACARRRPPPGIQRIEVVLALHETVPSAFRWAGHLRAPAGAAGEPAAIQSAGVPRLIRAARNILQIPQRFPGDFSHHRIRVPQQGDHQAQPLDFLRVQSDHANILHVSSAGGAGAASAGNAGRGGHQAVDGRRWPASRWRAAAAGDSLRSWQVWDPRRPSRHTRPPSRVIRYAVSAPCWASKLGRAQPAASSMRISPWGPIRMAQSQSGDPEA